MDWMNFFSGIIGSGVILTIGSGIAWIVYRKQNKTIKDNEAKQTTLSVEEKELELDRKQIDLGNEFMKSSLEMTRQMQEMMTKNQQRDESNWKSMFQRIDMLESLVTNIKFYLNGGFADFEKDLAEKKKNQLTWQKES